MKAVVIYKAGMPEELKVEERPIPVTKRGWVLIKVKAFGLNRSEMFTRLGDSPNVKFPRILGIECVGEVVNDLSGKLKTGQKVAALMGGMGREFDGGYAEYALVPEAIVFPLESKLPWETLGAIPEMFQTVSGSLNQALEIKKGEVLLIRGGTSSIGMLSCQLAKYYGLTVVSTTRNPDKAEFLKQNGADFVVIDDGTISQKIKALFPKGVHKVLELVGTETLKDSLKCIGTKGVVCMTGILGNSWNLPDFKPMGDIPSLGRLTCYMGDAGNLEVERFQDFINAVTNGEINLNIDSHFSIDQIVEAHTYMESNQAKGKIVVMV